MDKREQIKKQAILMFLPDIEMYKDYYNKYVKDRRRQSEARDCEEGYRGTLRILKSLGYDTSKFPESLEELAK